jgi:2-polyprenyl-3-methyl-5-hydroxy-6-metoxy-1,4-benzoquinol methylase
MSQTQLDANKAQAFAGQTIGMVNHSLLAFMVSIGHRTGLFDRMSTLPPSTAAEIARAAHLDERYVREWLSSMVTGRIVDYDGRRGTFHLPAEHAACLTRAAGPNNLAILTQFGSVYGAIESELVDCFENGGGVPYEHYHGFHDATSELSGSMHDAWLIDRILPTAGVADRLASGIDVIDIGCGKGHTLNLMAKAFPKSRFTGIDICEDAVVGARVEAARLGLRNVAFETRDAAKLEAVANYDLVTAFDTIHDQADPAGVLARIRKAVRSGGTFLCVDIAASSNLADNLEHPFATALYAVSTMHCMTVSLAQGGAGLGTMWGQEKALEMLSAAGFTPVDVKRVEGDFMNNYYVART